MRPSSWLIIGAAILGVSGVGYGLVASGNYLGAPDEQVGERPAVPVPPPKPIAAAEDPAVVSARLEECRAKLKAAAALGLVTGMSFDNGRPQFAVGPIWHEIDFAAKTNLAETAACFFLAGRKNRAVRFEITDSMSGKRLATWKYTKLDPE